MLSHKDSEKAGHYLELLNAARCNGRWPEVPEIARKVEKHAPTRRCLVLTAQTEHQIATQSFQKPGTAPIKQSQALSDVVSSLLARIEAEKNYIEDAFQARVCLAWLHTTHADRQQVLSRLPAQEIVQAIDRSSKQVSIAAQWQHVCIVKAACFRGSALESVGDVKEAIQSYDSISPYLEETQGMMGCPEGQLWTERLLARHCASASRQFTSSINKTHALHTLSQTRTSSLLTPFRKWAEYRSRRQMSPTSSDGEVWRSYYDILSILLQQQAVAPFFTSRSEQRVELQKVQAAYEATLMQELEFPKANQANVRIESWVDQVMANWRSMLDPTWQSEGLGPGGNAELGKTVLDILYRAATRSFHSTKILRHLFMTHAQLAEFNLAFKALDTYLMIVAKGKARVEKSGEAEIGLDDDEIALCTAAAGVKMLCVYGRRADVERAFEIADIIRKWLESAQVDVDSDSAPNGQDRPDGLDEKKTFASPGASNVARATAYHAIGCSHLYWARLTYETSSRSELRLTAISNFRRAIQLDPGERNRVEYLLALATSLAENLELDEAINTVKDAISTGRGGYGNTPVREADGESISRDLLMRCWHLLILLLSARQDFEIAIASCEAAFEPYGGKATLNGDTIAPDVIKSFTMSERKHLVELKMTQLALLETIEGPDEAVNASEELLSLYTQLFKVSEVSKKAEPRPASAVVSTNGTHGAQRSIRGSIMGYPRDRILKMQNGGTATNSVGSFDSIKEPSSGPTIAVTPDATGHPQEANQSSHRHHHLLGRHESNKLRKRNSRKSLSGQRRLQLSSHSKPPSSDGHLRPDGNIASRSSMNGSHAETLPPSDEVGLAISHDLPSSPVTPAATSDQPNPLHNVTSTTRTMASKNPNAHPVAPKPPTNQSTKPSHPIMSTTSLLSLPEARYPSSLEDRHSHSLLVKIWCLIAAIYRRAGLYLDAQGAIREATIHVQAIESAIASQEGSSASNFLTPGYGGMKALGELWADVMAETGALRVIQKEEEAASAAYETALSWWADHPAAIVGLAGILLDSYGRATTKTRSGSDDAGGEMKQVVDATKPTLASLPDMSAPFAELTTFASTNLTALSARDRAYSLLNALTKSGQGWDSPEAWFALARAYELGGQIGKAKDALWWVVELEEVRPIRQWGCARV